MENVVANELNVVLKGDLDNESMNLVNQILDEDNSHLGTLNVLISVLKNT
jgi:hypothetical protein